MSETRLAQGDTTVTPEVGNRIQTTLAKLRAAYKLANTVGGAYGDVRSDVFELGVDFGGELRLDYTISGSEAEGDATQRVVKISPDGKLEGKEYAPESDRPLSDEEARDFVLEYGPKVAEKVGANARTRAIAAIAEYDATIGNQ